MRYIFKVSIIYIYIYLNLIFAHAVTLHVYIFNFIVPIHDIADAVISEKLFSCKLKMPKVRRSKKPPPDGWELIEPTLEELEQKMREGNDTKKN